MEMGRTRDPHRECLAGRERAGGAAAPEEVLADAPELPRADRVVAADPEVEAATVWPLVLERSGGGERAGVVIPRVAQPRREGESAESSGNAQSLDPPQQRGPP